MIRRRPLAISATIFAAACSGVDLGDFIDHKCPLTYDNAWLSTDLKFDHTDPRYCPVAVVSAGQDMEVGGKGIDPDGAHIWPGEDVYIAVYSSAGDEVGYDASHWFQWYAEIQVYISTIYDAAMGVQSYTHTPNDHAVVGTTLSDGTPAHANIFLETLYGPRNEAITPPSAVAADTYCRFRATSTLDGEPRTAMGYAWSIDDEPVSSGNAPLLEMIAGWHHVSYDATDEYGYKTHADLWVQAVDGATSGDCT